MKKKYIAIIVFAVIIIAVIGTGYFLRDARDKNNNSVSQEETTAGTEEAKAVEDLNSEEAAKYEGDIVKNQKEQTEQGSLRHQYETMDWTGYEYTVNDVRLYKSYQAYRDSEDFSGNEIGADDGFGTRDCSIYMVADVKLKNTSNYKVEFNATCMGLLTLNDDGIHGYADSKYNAPETGGKIWYFMGNMLYPEIVKSEGDTMDRWDADKITLQAGEEINFSIMFTEYIWLSEIGENTQMNYIHDQMHPYDKFDHLNYYISIAGGMSDPNGEVKPNVPYDVENDKYELYVECDPEIIE